MSDNSNKQVPPTTCPDCVPCDLAGIESSAACYVTLTCGLHNVAACAIHAQWHVEGTAKLSCDDCGR